MVLAEWWCVPEKSPSIPPSHSWPVSQHAALRNLSSASSSQTEWSGQTSCFRASLLIVLVDKHTTSKWIIATASTAEEWAFHIEDWLFHVVLLWFVIRGKQSERDKEYSLKCQIVLSKISFFCHSWKRPIWVCDVCFLKFWSCWAAWV